MIPDKHTAAWLVWGLFHAAKHWTFTILLQMQPFLVVIPVQFLASVCATFSRKRDHPDREIQVRGSHLKRIESGLLLGSGECFG